eukprot:CAMPEP_0169091394 /NCGR_PEP_ID=MMETSP1015-20121227/16337_1 /TAXON_ID=342587 /ORGANISM="Karlodinium micrum, Strain CCMP2283" /LENGTH=111 /DNA_ID=CAMNT_0009151879 /DNA_START=651 /DNA_END=986 /DNA_ORIENTATION=-
MDMSSSVKQVFVGCLLSVCSQSLMLMVVSEEKGRIEGTLAEVTAGSQGGDPKRSKGKRRRGRDDNDSPSSSSSSDDSTPRTNPLLNYKTASVPTAGRNYRLPGGFDARNFR